MYDFAQDIWGGLRDRLMGQQVAQPSWGGVSSGWGGVPFAPGQGGPVLDPGAINSAIEVGSAANAGSYDWLSPISIFGGTQSDGTKINGWGSTALGLGQGLWGAYAGMKQLGMAEDMFDESKRQFNKNYTMQRKTLNTAMEDRQRARVASNPTAYQSVGDYMKENRI